MSEVRVLNDDVYAQSVELSVEFDAYGDGQLPYLRHVVAMLRHDEGVHLVQTSVSGEAACVRINLSGEEFDALVEARMDFLTERRNASLHTPGTQRGVWVHEDRPF